MTLSDCQQACEYIDNCTYFQFDKNEKICKLHSDQVATRVCDIVHGTQEPDFQTCLDMGSLRWALGGKSIVIQSFQFSLTKMEMLLLHCYDL